MIGWKKKDTPNQNRRFFTFFCFCFLPESAKSSEVPSAKYPRPSAFKGIVRAFFWNGTYAYCCVEDMVGIVTSAAGT